MPCPKHPNRALKEWSNGTQQKCTAKISDSGPDGKPVYCDYTEPMTAAAAGLAPTAATPSPAAASTALALPADQMFPAWVMKEVSPYLSDARIKLLLPAIPLNAPEPRGYRLSLSMVTINPDPSAKDVWPIAGGGLALSKTGLNKIADACGIVLDSWKIDDGKDPDYAAYKAVGVMRTASGEMRRVPGFKALRMSKVRERAIQIARKKNPNASDADLERAVAGEMAEYQMHLDARAETGAKLRVIRELVPSAGRSGLQAQDLGAFLLARLDVDLNDPVMRKHSLEMGERAMLALYGKEAKAEAREISHAEIEDGDLDEDEGFPQEPLQLGNAPMEDVNAEPDWISRFVEMRAAMGISSEESNALAREHRGDFKAMCDALNKRGAR